MKTLAERFLANVVRGGPDECWPYTRGKDSRGYGRIMVDGKSVKAHRVAWELANGPIPSGMCICHHCDNPPCCNPAHLFVGTPADNVRDCKNKGRNAKGDANGLHIHPERAARGDANGARTRPDRRARGEANGSAKLTVDAVRTIRQRSINGEKKTQIAADFGISNAEVIFIVQRKRWAHVT